MAHHRQKSNNPPTPVTDIDIIIPVYQGFEFLDMCLKALPKACEHHAYNVIVVDNGSPKEDADAFYSKLDSKIIVIRNRENLGFAKACNIGARRKSSKYLLFLNDDVVLWPYSIDAMIYRLDKDEKIGVVGAKLLFPEGTKSGPPGKVQHVGIFTNIRGEFEHVYIGWSADNPHVHAVKECIAVTGAALMTRRVLWNKIGGFNEIYGMGTYEDVEYCLNIHASDHLVEVAQDAVGWHYTNATASKYKITFPLTQNRAIFMSRWAGRFPWTAWLYG